MSVTVEQKANVRKFLLEFLNWLLIFCIEIVTAEKGVLSLKSLTV